MALTCHVKSGGSLTTELVVTAIEGGACVTGIGRKIKSGDLHLEYLLHFNGEKCTHIRV